MNSQEIIVNDESSETRPSGVDLRDFYYALFRHKGKILTFFALGILGSIAAYFLRPPVYESRAKLLVPYVLEREAKSLSPTTAADPHIKSTDPGGANIINTEKEILSSFDLASEVADTVGPDKLLAKAGGGTNRTAAAAAIARGLVIDTAKGGGTLTVVFQNPDPGIVQPVLSQLIDSYRKKHVDIHRAVGVFDDFLSRKTDELRNSLKDTDDKLRELKKSAGVVSVEDAKKTYADQISKIRTEVISAEAELAAQKAALEEPERPIAVNLTSNAAPIATELKVSPEKVDQYKAIAARLESFRRQENEYLLHYTEESFFVISVRENITRLEQQKRKLEEEHPQLTKLNLPSTIGGGPAGQNGQLMDPSVVTSRRIRELEAKIKFLKEQWNKIRAEADKVDAVEPEVTRLQLQRELLDKNYHYYQSSLEQSRVDETLGAGKFSNIKVIQEPTPPAKSAAKTLKLMGIALALGVFGGIGLALLIELVLDHSVRRPNDVTGKLRLPLFLTIPYTSKNGRSLPDTTETDSGPIAADGKATQARPPAASNRTEGASKSGILEIAPWDASHGFRAYYEALRDRLITHFEVNNMTHKPKLIALASCSRGAGVTSIAAGLAATLSETGEGSVLLVDMNLKDGAAHPFYKGKPACGLSDVLETGKRDPALVHQNLYLASANEANGKLPRILPKRFVHLVPKLKASDYDYIIFDMPAITQTSITSKLASYMDMMLLVLESEKTDSHVVEQASSLLAESGASTRAILNKYRQYVPNSLQPEL